MKVLFKVFLIVSLVLSIGAVSCNAQFLFFGNPLVGKEAPDFTLKNLAGKDVNITQFRDGQNAIYFFWATWCPHCRDAISTLNKKLDEFDAKKVKVVLINEGENAKVVRTFAEKYKINVEILLDERTKLADEYSLVGLPTFVYVKKDGTVRAVKHSLVEDLDLVFKETK